MTGSPNRRERRRARPWSIAAAAVLVLVAACTSVAPSATPAGPSPSATSSAAASPTTASTSTPAASPSAGAADCGPGDLTMQGGPWGGAAGSRGADVTVTGGAAACRLPAHPVVAMADSSGKDLIHSTLPVTDDGPILEPGATRAFSFRVSNWCDPTARLPLQAVGLVADGAIEIGGLVMRSDELPPCNGAGQPALVEATDWQ